MAKQPLTVTEWKAVIARAARAERLAWDIVVATNVTLPVATGDCWIKLHHRIQRRTTWLMDRCCDATLHLYSGSNHDEAKPSPWERPAEQPELAWFRGTKASGSCRKRPLARPEWVLFGDLVKTLRAELFGICQDVQKAYPKADALPWIDLSRTLDRLKSKLDGECCRQHLDWDAATTVFYGELLAENDRLAASVDVAEVNAIATMSAEDVRSIAEKGRSKCPLRHWNQLFPLNRRPATPEGAAR